MRSLEVRRRGDQRRVRDCWQEWRDTSAQLINHYGLVLGNPAQGQQLRTAMREFLNMDEDEA